MIKQSKISTYSKILLFIVLSTIVFLLFFIGLYYYTSQQEKQVYLNSEKQFTNEMNSLLLLNSESIISTISDMTYWDELVNFVYSKDKLWFTMSIEPSLGLYKLDYIGVYDIQQNLIMKASSSKIKQLDFIPKEAILKLYEKKVDRFFFKTTDGILEIYGATIHPSNDALKNKTKPQGFLFMVKVLDYDSFKKLEKISSAKISFANSSVTQISNKELRVSLDINDWKGKTINKLVFKRSLNVDFFATKRMLYVIFLGFFIALFFLYYLSKKWIHEPLQLITNVLQTENKKDIKLLRSKSVEFGNIGDLIDDNIKQRKQLQIEKQKAEESDNLKSAFLSNLSHEIRTPMNAIVGFSDLLNNSKLKQSERLEYLNVINQSGNNLVSIIDDLVEMSKIDAHQIKPNYTSLNLDSCVNELFNAIKITIPKDKNIDFELIRPINTITKKILTDEIKLKQIIINLITNAIKFTENGFVTFGYEINEVLNTIVFTINDTGLGIDKEHQDLIFDRFRRIEGDYATKVGGLGLGLAISKAYIDMLEGSISLQSTVGVGSRFSVNLPLIIDHKVAIVSRKIIDINHDLSKGNETILIAEDDNINFLLIEKIMQLKNYKIIRAKNGQEAVDICKANNQIDLVLMDIKMPVLNGFEALAEIKKFKPELPVIAQSAYSSIEDYHRMIQAGFLNCVTKPINKEKLFEVIAETLK
jgi:signal transduction histidine kinase/CheY-like chemotaxis protein